MIKLSFPRLLALTAVGLVLAGGGVAVAQQAAPNIMQPIEWDKRRLDQLDRNVRRLERALTQRNAAGQPVLVEPEPFDQDGQRVICYPGDPAHPVREPAWIGPTRLRYRNRRFEAEGGLAALLG